MKLNYYFEKLYRYEYWSFWQFYIPMLPLWLFYAIKAKSLIYFCNVNPGMKWGGFLDYSKFDPFIYIPASYKPVTILIKNLKNPEAILPFPFVAKPNKGERGKGVEIIENQEAWSAYLTKTSDELIVQELIRLPKEYGLFYVKVPHKKNGMILSITAKGFLTYVGDGKTSLQSFISNNTRALNRKDYLEKKYSSTLSMVLRKGEEMILEPIGNHNRGTTFLDASHLISDKLTATLDSIAKGIPGFFYGRFDVKTSSDDALKNGEFVILEVNGANSEPTHIYHPGKFTLIQAYKEVIKHLNWQYKIAYSNYKSGYPYAKPLDLAKTIMKHIFKS